jgi:hypothetical protein
MARCAIVNKDGLVVNVSVWEGKPWLPPTDHYAIVAEVVDIGDSYDFDNDVVIRLDRTAKDPE